MKEKEIQKQNCHKLSVNFGNKDTPKATPKGTPKGTPKLIRSQMKRNTVSMNSNFIRQASSMFPEFKNKCLLEVPSSATIETEKNNDQNKQLNDYENIRPIKSSFNRTTSTNCELKTSQIKVVARFRPINFLEETFSKKSEGKLCVNFLNKSNCSIISQTINTDFTLDMIFDCETKQSQLYEEVVEASINDVLNGYNGTIFTYGQSGSGKTYTMFGQDIWDEEKKGIIPRSIDQIFNFFKDEKNEGTFELNFSIIEIYKENLNDLLNHSNKQQNLKIKEDPRKGIYVDNITSVNVINKEDFLILIEEAEDRRSVAETKLNKLSSRSHIVFCLSIKNDLKDGSMKTGTLNLVDLAGSEKVSKTGAIGGTLEEAKKINFSLSCLGNVINALASGNTEFVPYRESKLTRLLKDSLGGNFKTTLIVNCSPHSYNIDETLSTLNFAKRAKNVKNKIKINLKKSPEEYERTIKNLEEKLRLEILKNESLFNFSPANSLPLEYFNSLKIKVYDEFENEVQSNNKNFEENLVAKDEEISKLKEENDNLRNEIKSLNHEIKKLKNLMNIDKTIHNLEESVKNNICNLDTSLYSYPKTNLLLNESFLIKEFSNLEETNPDLPKKLSNLDENFNKIINNLRCETGENPFIISYENTYKKSKLFINECMSDYIKKSDMFNLETLSNEEENILINKKKYNNLKNSLLQVNALSIYYEKLLNDLFYKLSIDLSKLLYKKELFMKISDQNIKIQNFSSHFKNYLDVLDEVKMMKYNQIDVKSTLIKGEEITYNRNNNDKTTNKLRRRYSNVLNGKDLISNIINSKLYDNLNCKLNVNKNKNTIVDECLNENDIQSELPLTICESKTPSLKQNEYFNDYNLNIIKSESNEENDHTGVSLKRKETKTKMMNLCNKVRKSIESSDIKTTCNTDNNFTNDILHEVRLLRKEKTLNTEFIVNLTNDNLEQKRRIKELENMLNDSSERFKISFKKDIENAKLNSTILKDFFNDEIRYSHEIIKKLSTTIDDILLNKNLFHNSKFNNKNIFNELYSEHKLNIFQQLNSNRINFNQIAESIINESGTATKKMDFVRIDFNENSHNEKINIVYGSGIDKKLPSKCPLYKNLKYNPPGDLGTDFILSDEDK